MAYGMQPQRDPTEVMGRRIVAYIVDFVLFAGIFIAVMAVTKDHAFTGAPSGACGTLRDGGFNGVCVQFGHRVYTWKGGQAALGYLLAALLGFLNIGVLQGITGASVGKQIMGLRVVNAQGQPCGIGRALLRSLLLIVDNLFCFLVGILVAALTHPHRRVGDMAAGTYVVAVADAGQPVLAGAPAPYPYGYQQAGPPGWAPPGAQPPAPGWGAPPAPQAAPWGAPPPAAPPTWGATPPAAAPEPQQPPWGAPAAPPPTPAPPPPPVDRSGWDAPLSPWTTPPPAAQPAPTPPSPPAPAPPPPTVEPAPPASPDELAAPDASAPPAEGESWWSKAVSDEDEPEK